MKIDTDKLTAKIKEFAIEKGAVLVGVASIDRFEPMPPYYDRAPRGQHPKDFLPNAKSVISIAQPILNAAIDATATLRDVDMEMMPPDARSPWLDSFYHQVAHRVQDDMLLMIGQLIGQLLMSYGYDAMIFPTEGVHAKYENMTEEEVMQGPSEDWAKKYSPFRYISGPFSHRHAATRAGLGEFGYNNLLLTREFGARQRINSVITDAELVPSPLITKPICLRDKCMLCLKACYMDAIICRDDKTECDYRTVETVNKDIIFIDTPFKTNPLKCRQRTKRIQNYPTRGDCVRICPIPKVPVNLPNRLKAIVEDWQNGSAQTDETT